jgi:hypothetical protein
VWALPLLALAGALALAWRRLGMAGAAVFALGVVATLSAVAWWGAPPWTSRVLARAGRRGPRTGRRLVLVATALTASPPAAAALVVHEARDVLVLTAFAALQADVSVALVGVRQWRFAPTPRLWSAAALLAAAMLGFAYAGLGFRGDAWGLPVLVVALAVPTIVGWPLGALGDRASRHPHDDPPRGDAAGPLAQRMPDSRNASR